ncbi:uncharacterized protein Pyn_01503 [Prunus yedoensis var. nudiflora]|uniref:Uncharacterized protein n=1 Tax=Prunus yedoensis var. nudiflora TaxID=2094558 RepID=A0A314UCA9_PRUYE|nr:uncharacterized protein Pyn_01503 [Prunus yedoensis var. nudiflora]
MPLALLSQESTVVTKLVVIEATVASVPSPPPVCFSGHDLARGRRSLRRACGRRSLRRNASLHEEGGSSAPSEPLDEDSRAAVERLRDFLHMGVHQMTNAETFMEFRSCLDTAMALGLLDSVQLDELQVRLAEGEEMIGRYAESGMKMTEGCSLEQELAEIKQQAQPAMAQLKENDLVIKRENEELAQVEAQIVELQARRDLILERRNQAATVGAELKSSAKQLLKAAAEKKKALAERKLIRARWLADMDSGDIAWRRITCLIWGMFSEGI